MNFENDLSCCSREILRYHTCAFSALGGASFDVWENYLHNTSNDRHIEPAFHSSVNVYVHRTKYAYIRTLIINIHSYDSFS